MKKILLAIMFVVIFTPLSVSAHPGRTDSSGCHTCRTNCTEKWGLEYGEYHCHNGGSSGGGSNGGSGSSTYEAPPVVDHYKNGYDAGWGAGYSSSSSVATDIPSGNKDFESGYKQGFSDGHQQQQNEYNDGKNAGYDHKINNKNNLYADPENCSAAYVNGYKSGFSNADEEIKAEVESLAKTATAQDIVKAVYNSVISEELSNYQGHFESIYKTRYQSLLDGYLKQVAELGISDGRDDALSQRAYDDVLNNSSFPKLEEIENEYQIAYAEGYAKGENERRSIFTGITMLVIIAISTITGITLFIRMKRKKKAD